jgi:hypothetical protein
MGTSTLHYRKTQIMGTSTRRTANADQSYCKLFYRNSLSKKQKITKKSKNPENPKKLIKDEKEN